MRVCILSSVHRALDGRVFYRQARSLARAGHAVTLVAMHDRDEVRDGVRIIGLPASPRWRRPAVWWRLLRRAVETGADVYHFHDPELLFVTPWLARRTGSPTIYDVHEAYPEFFLVKDDIPAVVRYPLAWSWRLAEPALARLHSALVFADDATPEAFRHVPRPRMVLHNFPDAELVAAGNRCLDSVPYRDPVILYLGGLERNRGSALMIDAFARVRQRHRAARLLHVGHCQPPELAREILADARARGIDDAVELVGRVPFAEIGRWLERAAVGWITWQPVAKNRKNVPTKLFEYWAFGLPVVTSDLPSIRPFAADGDNARLVPASDPEAHAAAICGMLEDRERASRLGRQGREAVTGRFNWQAIEPRLLELYASLVPPG